MFVVVKVRDTVLWTNDISEFNDDVRKRSFYENKLQKYLVKVCQCWKMFWGGKEIRCLWMGDVLIICWIVELLKRMLAHFIDKTSWINRRWFVEGIENINITFE